MENEIKERIIEIFKPRLQIIENQTNCEHDWKDKDGEAYFRCNLCDYLAQDSKLDKLIFTQKLIKKGMTKDQILKFKDFI